MTGGIWIGSSGGRRHGMAALADGGELVAACPQERVTRVRSAGVNASGLPDEAIDVLLAQRGKTRADVEHFVPPVDATTPLDRHRASACTSYLTSGLASSAIVVCDADEPAMTIWRGQGAGVTHVATWPQAAFVGTYARMTALFGFNPPGAEPRMEALARLKPGARDTAVDDLLRLDGEVLTIDAAAEQRLTARLAQAREPAGVTRATLASAVQERLGDLLLELLRKVRHQIDDRAVCLAGSLFHNSCTNARVRQSGVFDTVFIPVDPGPAGLAVGRLLEALGRAPSALSPFLGPAYSPQETKNVLDNCKLQYAWETEGGAIRSAVEALREGRLVGWFDDAMEWGPRALGTRCILANPSTPYVLENLNRFLKGRESWRGYALSGLEESVAEHFAGPPQAPFMECDYRPVDPARFTHVLPSPEASVRIQTVSAQGGSARFRMLLEAFGNATGLPFLVNTSFNGFHEPIVCNPRDAVRVFFGTGLDVLVVNQFVMRK